MFESDPIMRIEWRLASSLKANAYNPNVVHRPELRLLEHSLITSGWIQPILITPAGTIIDGFHRWRLAQDSTTLRDKYGGHVPCVVLDIPEPEAEMLTVRINRAKGTHVAVRMHEIVLDLIDKHGYSREQVAQGIGASLEEVDLLYQENIFIARSLDKVPYSKAWVPRYAARPDLGASPAAAPADDV